MLAQGKRVNKSQDRVCSSPYYFIFIKALYMKTLRAMFQIDLSLKKSWCWKSKCLCPFSTPLDTTDWLHSAVYESAQGIQGIKPSLQNLIYRLIKVVEYENRTSLLRINSNPPLSLHPEAADTREPANEDVWRYRFRSICMQLQHIA